MKKLLPLYGLLLLLLTGCTTKKDDVEPDPGGLVGTWQWTRLTTAIVKKDGNRQEESAAASANGVGLFTTFTSDGKVRGSLPTMWETLADYSFFDVEAINADYRYEISGDELVLIGESAMENVYFKLERSGNTMTWTQNKELVEKSVNATLAGMVLNFDSEDLDIYQDIEAKFEFRKK